MKLPTIHLNGTSRKELYEQVEAASDAVRDAIEKLQAMRPNGRDYYPQDQHNDSGSAFYTAQDEHQARIHKLIAVYRELCQMAEHIIDAPGPGKL